MTPDGHAPQQDDFILFIGKGTCSIGPEIVLEEVGAPYQSVPINVRGNETRGAKYLAINPAGQVPFLIFPDGKRLSESAAIMLAFRTFSKEHPLGADWCDTRMNELHRWLFFLAGSVTRAYGLSGRPEKFADGVECQAAITRMARQMLSELWDVVEKATEGQHFFREGYSIVDAYIVMQLLWDQDRSSVLSTRPRLQRLFETTSERPAVQRIIERHSNPEFWRFGQVDLRQFS